LLKLNWIAYGTVGVRALSGVNGTAEVRLTQDNLEADTRTLLRLNESKAH
jgi:hypothetical protein